MFFRLTLGIHEAALLSVDRFPAVLALISEAGSISRKAVALFWPRAVYQSFTFPKNRIVHFYSFKIKPIYFSYFPES